MQVNEWKQVVRKVGKRSTSSIFSMRYYYVYECALERERILEVLVQFYNVIIKHNHYPSMWLKIVDIVLEKEKVPRLKKLRTLEMIEAYLQLVMRMCLEIRMNEIVDLDLRLSNAIMDKRTFDRKCII